jgi:hypothetical protein
MSVLAVAPQTFGRDDEQPRTSSLVARRLNRLSDMVADGYPVRSIAHALGRSVNAVTGMCRKAGLRVLGGVTIAVQVQLAPSYVPSKSAMELSEIDRGGAVRVRLLIIDSDQAGRIVAAADGLRPLPDRDSSDRQALLPLRETDLGDQLWKIDIDYRFLSSRRRE